jgi:hypothetical protein
MFDMTGQRMKLGPSLLPFGWVLGIMHQSLHGAMLSLHPSLLTHFLSILI